MKRILLLLFTAILCVLSAKAQVCKISATNDNVEVFSCVLTENNSKVSISVANDSQNISANVTVTVEVIYSSTIKKMYSGKAIAKPNESTPIEIPILAEVNGNKAKSVSVISITGTKCL